MKGKKEVLTDEDRLKLLEERYKKKEISRETYESLKKELIVKETTAKPPSQPTKETAPELSHDERLKFLEERRKKGEISDQTYNELKAELEAAKAGPIETAPGPGMPPPTKAKKFPVLPIIAVIAIVGIIIAAVAVSGVMSGGEKESKEEKSEEASMEGETWEEIETIEGDIAGGGPGTFGPNEEVQFEVTDTVVQMDIGLTWDPQSMDLDLVIEDPNGNEKGSSGNAPGEPESVSIRSNIDPGMWTAVIDPFAALNVHYVLEITYYHESGNITGGEGDLLYQEVKTLSDESGDGTDTFKVEEDYEGLFIQFEASSGSGNMTIEIEDPDGNGVFSDEVSGEDQVYEDETVDAKKGEWKVNYSFDEFTGTIVVQIIGL